MHTNKNYIRLTQIILVFVFLVILAGGIVRTTQSGMGCPDWPRCFGMLIPPTSASQLPPDYEKYLSKQDIDHTFNAFHTWTEYINRLCTAVLGILVIIHVVWSFKNFFKAKPIVFWLSFIFLIIIGVEAWLGKVVVDTNLAVVKITAHMLLALVLAAVPVIILYRLTNQLKVFDKTLKAFVTISLVVLLAQIIIGTDVREQIDKISASFDYAQRNIWISRLDNFFLLHKIISGIVCFFCVLIFWKSLSNQSLQKRGVFILVVVFCIMALGFTMAYFQIPSFAQPLHLLFSSVLFISLFALRLRLK